MIAVLLLVAAGGVLVACLQHARTEGWAAPGLRQRRGKRLPAPPLDDQPPPNLPPLIPSQRAITREFERGLRELTLFLAVRPGE